MQKKKKQAQTHLPIKSLGTPSFSNCLYLNECVLLVGLKDLTTLKTHQVRLEKNNILHVNSHTCKLVMEENHGSSSSLSLFSQPTDTVFNF